jgi:hypothetical protein
MPDETVGAGLPRHDRSRPLRLRVTAGLIALVVATGTGCSADRQTSTAPAEGRFTFLKTVSVGELNTILDAGRADFLKEDQPGPGYQLTPVSKAANAVDIYSVLYETGMPERGNERVTVSGLLALPQVADQSTIPLISYQHGTVYHRYAVPSYAFADSTPSPHDHRPESYEDRYMVALFGGSGYAVMAADYVGMGADAGNGEAYLIKGSSAQASFDLFRQVQTYLATRNIKAPKFFLAGWSQGGLNTTGFLEKLESNGVEVSGAFTAAAPNDPFAALNAALFHPLATDSPFFAPMIGQLAFSCERYGGPAGLAKAALNPEFYPDLKSIYERSYGDPPGDPNALLDMMSRWEGMPIVNFLAEDLRDPAAFAASDFGRCLAANDTYRQDFKAELRMYFGTDDAIVRPRIGRLAYDYHLALNATPQAQTQSRITPFLVEGGTHRRSFITGSVAAKSWMDSLS